MFGHIRTRNDSENNLPIIMYECIGSHVYLKKK